MEHTEVGRRTPLTMLFVGIALSMLTVSSGFGQSTIESVEELRGKYEGAYDLLIQPVHDLNKQYTKALERLLEQEAEAGRLESSLQVKNELDSFGDGRDFNEQTFNAREYALPNLQRIRDTYLAQRSKTWKNLEKPRNNLLKKYIQQLSTFEKEQTKLQNFEAALAAQKETTRVIQGSGDPSSDSELFEGRIRFIVKGDIELWHNGDRKTFQNESKNSQYIVGKTDTILFKNGDLIQMKLTGTAVFRSAIMFLQNEEKTKYLAFTADDYLIGERKHLSEKIEIDEIKSLSNHPGPGPADAEMASAWREMEIDNSVSSTCQWVKIEAKGEDNYYISVLDKTRLIETP